MSGCHLPRTACVHRSSPCVGLGREGDMDLLEIDPPPAALHPVATQAKSDCSTVFHRKNLQDRPGMLHTRRRVTGAGWQRRGVCQEHGAENPHFPRKRRAFQGQVHCFRTGAGSKKDPSEQGPLEPKEREMQDPCFRLNSPPSPPPPCPLWQEGQDRGKVRRPLAVSVV